MNAVRRIDLSTLKLGTGPEGQVSLRSRDMSCLSLSLSYVENSLLSSILLLKENRSGCGREISEDVWERKQWITKGKFPMF